MYAMLDRQHDRSSTATTSKYPLKHLFDTTSPAALNTDKRPQLSRARTMSHSRRLSNTSAASSASTSTAPPTSPPTRSRSNTLSNPLQFTAMSSQPMDVPSRTHVSSSIESRSSMSGTRTSASSRRSSPRISRTSSPVQPLMPPSPSHSPDLYRSNSPTHSRMHSRSAASIHQQHHATPVYPPHLHPQPQPIFATPGGYYAYPFFTHPPPPGSDSMRPSYSSPHLPYAFDASQMPVPIPVQAQDAASQLPPPYSYPGPPSSSYAYPMPPQNMVPVPVQMPEAIPSQPASQTSFSHRQSGRNSHRNSTSNSEADEQELLAFSSSRRGSRTSASFWADAHSASIEGDEALLMRRAVKKKRSKVVLIDETETDEPTKSRGPSSPAQESAPFRFRHPWLSRLIPPMVLIFRLLAIVPASAAMVSHVWNFFDPSRHPSHIGRVDYFVSLLWALLTAHQCLSMTNGLFLRWKAYYPLIPTLIRLLALQAICWPATHFTLKTFDHIQRPLICWTIIGSTTCVSKGIQIWATSNLVLDERRRGKGRKVTRGEDTEREEEGRTRDWMSGAVAGLGGVGGGKRRWDWNEIGLKAGLPAAVLYFVMGWSLLLGREFIGC